MMDWCTNTAQPATLLDIGLSEEVLTIVIARKEEVETPSLFQRISGDTGKFVSHVLVAGGTSCNTTYPIDVTVHRCPIYHKGSMRSNAMHNFWNSCKEAAAAGQAVLVHSNNSYHLSLIHI